MTNILVAEDEREIAQAIKLILEDEGYAVQLCSNGLEAVEYMSKTKPDLVITDIMMPLASGYDVLLKMKDSPALQHVPTILMSCVNPSVKQRTYNWTAFIKKPFDIEQFVEAVKHALQTA